MSERINKYVVVIDPPAEYPFTLEEARLFCKVDTDNASPDAHPDDDLLNMLIAGETKLLDSVDGWLGRALMTQTLELVLDRFPCEDGGKLYLPFPPLQEVVSVFYIDSNGDEQLLEGPTGSPQTTGDYRIVEDAQPAWIEPVYGTSWPATRGSAAVRVRFIAGYGTRDRVPESIKEYLQIKIATRYEYREEISMGQVIKIPHIEHMLENYRIR